MGGRPLRGALRDPRRAHRLARHAAGLMLAAAVARAESGAVAGSDAPGLERAASPGGVARWFDPASAPFIPIPEIDTAPHSGLTLGVIPTFLSTNEHDEINRILAPDIIHNQYFGWGARARAFGYPSEDTEWSVVGGLKQRTEREFDAVYATGLRRRSPFSWSVEAIYDRSGVPRFFGLGNDSHHRDETSYVSNQGRINATAGWNLSQRLQVSYTATWRDVRVLPSALPELTSIGTRFPDLVGLAPAYAIDHRVQFGYDSRNERTIPTDGGSYVVYGSFASRALGSSFADTAFGIDARRFWPVNPDLVVACHGALRYMPSAGGAPFWALSRLGGDRSVLAEAEPLRAYGADRYIDRNLFASSLELRTRVASLGAFGTRLDIQLAPFVDVGKVYAGMGTSPFTHLHRGAGVGIRGVASPYVVGYVDIGFGSEKAAVFSGINYPF